MKMPFGLYEGIDIIFLSSGYLHSMEKRLRKQVATTMFNDDTHQKLLSAINEELERRTQNNAHFFSRKVIPTKSNRT